VGINPHGLALADFNGDGHADLVTANRTSKDLVVLLGGGDGTFRPLPPVRIDEDIITLDAADFDRDGRPDLVLLSASSNHVMIWRGQGDGTFRPMPSYR
jgi:hypothetical protein